MPKNIKLQELMSKLTNEVMKRIDAGQQSAVEVLFYDSMRYKYWFQCVWGGKEMGQNILTTNYACQKNGRGCTGYIINLHNLAKQKYGPCGTANGFSYDYFAAAPSLEYGFAEENNAYDNNAQHHQHRHHGGYHAYNPTYMGNTQGVYNGFHP
ncbi:hypothetical protein RI367_002625 [Sorochytrium milnesiophthora]